LVAAVHIAAQATNRSEQATQRCGEAASQTPHELQADIEGDDLLHRRELSEIEKQKRTKASVSGIVVATS
jgi:hypothetical protein